jgi:hypothetical protein
MFLALLTLNDFIAEAREAQTQTIHIQSNIKSEYYGGIQTHLRSYVTLTAIGLAAGATAPILAARIRIEVVELHPADGRAREQAIEERMGQARVIISDYVADTTGARIAPGLLLHSGMLEDLNKIETSQALWGWNNPKDPIARAITLSEPPF